MSRKIIIIVIVLANLVFEKSSIAQQNKKDSTTSFSLKSAQDYSTQNSPVIKNANLDMESAKKKVWETTSMGLPQASAKFAYSYMTSINSKIKEFSSLSSLGSWMYGVDETLKNMTSNPAFGHVPAPDPNQKTPTDQQMKWGSTLDITVSQLLFSGSYIVGLQTSKVFKQLSEIAVTKSQNDVLEGVTNAYYLVLIAEENKTIIDSIYTTTEKTLNMIKGMRAQGMVDETDVDQLQLTLGTINNTSEMLKRQVELARNLLKFQMGIDLGQNIILTDKLDKLISSSDLNSLALKEFKVENFSDYRLMETQEKLAALNLKYQKSTLLPDVAAFYQHDENFNKNSFTFTPPNLIGLGVNIPIFGSGMKISRIQQAKLSLLKATNSKEEVSSGLQVSFMEAKSSYLTALSTFRTNKENIVLSEKIYKRNLIKYKEGTLSSLDLAQSHNQYLQSEGNYYKSLIDLISAKSKLEKMLK